MSQEDGELPLTTPLLGTDQAQPDSGVRRSSTAADEDTYGDTLPTASPEASHATVLATTPWVLTTCIMLGDMFGLGTLSLPSNFARLGWVPGSVLLAALTIGGVYSGVLYTRLATRCPKAQTFDQIADVAMGKWGRYLVYGSVYLTILGEPVMFQLTSTEALTQAFSAFGLQAWQASIIVAVLIFPLSQVQHMHDVGWISIAGTLGMLLSVAVVLAKLAAMGATQGVSQSSALFAGAPYQVALVGVMDTVFTYGGQVNWMRYISTMRNRHHFNRAVAATTAFMSVLYVAVAGAGYAVLGADVDLTAPITSVVGNDVWAAVMNAGLFVHCIFAYQINVNVWSSIALHLLMPKLADEIDHAGHDARKRSIWMGVTAICIVFSFFVARIFPFFTIVMAVIASLGDIASMYTLPALFAIKLLKPPRAEVALCWVLVVFSTVLTVAGLYSSVHQLVQAMLGHH